MKYIEIKEGLSIRLDEIEAIEKVNEYNSTVYTHHNLYASTFPYMTLISLLEAEGEEEDRKDSQVTDNINQLAKYQQHWIG